MKYLSLFSGYGGFELGIQQAYGVGTQSTNKKSKQTEPQIQFGGIGTTVEVELSVLSTDKWGEWPICIGFSEIDKYAIQIYKKHFPYEECEQCRNNRSLGNRQQLATQTDLQQKETLAISPSGLGDGRGKLSVNNCQCKHKPYGDITKIDPATLPYFDLLCGGFPCQAFSIAGKRAGFEDTRGTLIYDVFRIIKEKHPKLVLLENVKGLLSHDNGRTFKTIITSLAELGYAVEWQVLNAKNFGVPQNRERVFIVGHFGGFSGRQVFPIGRSNENNNESSGKGLSSTITRDYYKGLCGSVRQGLMEITKNVSQGYRVYNPKGIACNQASQAGGVGAKTGLYAIPVLTPDRINKRQNGRRFKEDGDPSFTLTGQDKHGIYDGVRIRRLTPTECERLMGLPDGWLKTGVDENGNDVEISDTQRYKMAGNGIVIPIVKHIITKLIYEQKESSK